MKAITLSISKDAIDLGMAAGKSAGRFSGYVCCARVYIQPVGRVEAASRKRLEAAGLRIMPRAHNSPAIYMGYDNATGVDYGKALAMAAVFNAAGFTCYADADQD